MYVYVSEHYVIKNLTKTKTKKKRKKKENIGDQIKREEVIKSSPI